MTKPSLRKEFAGPTLLAAFVAPLIEPALARQGMSETSLLTEWPEIVGAHLARFCRPIELQWPRASRRDPDAQPASATLVLRVDGAFALEAQHSSAVLIERVNAHLGWRCVGKIAFRQGPLDRPARRAAKPAPPSAHALEKAAAYAAPIVADDLRDALTRLGARTIEKAAR